MVMVSQVWPPPDSLHAIVSLSQPPWHGCSFLNSIAPPCWQWRHVRKTSQKNKKWPVFLVCRMWRTLKSLNHMHTLLLGLTNVPPKSHQERRFLFYRWETKILIQWTLELSHHPSLANARHEVGHLPWLNESPDRHAYISSILQEGKWSQRYLAWNQWFWKHTQVSISPDTVSQEPGPGQSQWLQSTRGLPPAQSLRKIIHKPKVIPLPPKKVHVGRSIRILNTNRISHGAMPV